MTNEKLLEKIRTLEEICRALIGRVKALEQQGSYYPTKEEISSIKIGGPINEYIWSNWNIKRIYRV